MKIDKGATRFLYLLLLPVLIGIWVGADHFQLYRSDLFPSFSDFLRTVGFELQNGRLVRDVCASLFRWGSGFFLAVIVAVPLGLWLGVSRVVREILSPYFNLMRSLSPLAWLPFAVIWFGIGDVPVIFLIFLGSVFPLLFSITNTVRSVPKVYDQLARDYHFRGFEYGFQLLFPAVLPQILASCRLVAALGWIVLVPAEMLAGKDGLGFAIMDARNGMRTDLLVLNMLVIALIAHATDLLLKLFDLKATVRWSYES